MILVSHLRHLLWYLLAGSRGGETRAKILMALKERPYNANQLTRILSLDYKTVTLLIRKFVGDDLSLYYELKPLKTRELACGSLETEEA
jgi:DNA-binding transcriptional ArsR family regulator